MPSRIVSPPLLGLAALSSSSFELLIVGFFRLVWPYWGTSRASSDRGLLYLYRTPRLCGLLYRLALVLTSQKSVITFGFFLSGSRPF